MASVTDTETLRAGRERPGSLREGTQPVTRAGHRVRRRGPFSGLTRRILAVNLLALAFLGGGFIYLNQYERGLYAGRIEALTTQGQIIAAALGESAVPPDPTAPQRIDTQTTRNLLHRLVNPINTRARVFDASGTMVADSRSFTVLAGEVRMQELPPPTVPGVVERHFEGLIARLEDWLNGELPPYVEIPDQRAVDYVEVMHALSGASASAKREAIDGSVIVSVAVPVQRFKQVLGALMLSTRTEDIERLIQEAWGEVFKLVGAALAFTTLLSLYLAGTIARPIRRLADAAEQVRHGQGRKVAIPDFRDRGDELGELGVALDEMTKALWDRMDAIERFAADVAHEIKNPLSSLRTATETAARVSDPEAQKKLLGLLTEDVKRLDRLITDIAAVSRLDAELSRAETAVFDLAAMLRTIVELYPDSSAEVPRVVLRGVSSGCDIRGVESRLGQVFRNLLDNARSFGPAGTTIAVTLRIEGGWAVVTIDDEGPGIPQNKAEAIFGRFYSERPEGEKYGTHSGLGLNIARQIVEAHNGDIMAANRPSGGARFTVRLPLHQR